MSIEKKLGVVPLEQLGQLVPYPNQLPRAPEPTDGEENPLKVPPTGRPYTSDTAQATRSKHSRMIYGAAANIAGNRNSRSSLSTPTPRRAGRNSAR